MDLAQTEADLEARCAIVDRGLEKGIFTKEEALLRKKSIYDATIISGGAGGNSLGGSQPPPQVTPTGGKGGASTTSTVTVGAKGRAPSTAYNKGYKKGGDPKFKEYRDDVKKTGAYYYIVTKAAALEGFE